MVTEELKFVHADHFRPGGGEEQLYYIQYHAPRYIQRFLATELQQCQPCEPENWIHSMVLTLATIVPNCSLL